MGISQKDFAKMQQRVSRPKGAPAPIFSSPPANAGRDRIVLGIDPSLRGTGYGVIRAGRGQPMALAFGVIPCSPGWPRSQCLVRIAERLREVIQETKPSVCVIEGLFYAQNLQTALIMGEARGAALATIASSGVEIFEIAPRKVKQAIVGYGAAQKLAVARMVQRMLRLSETPQADAADALALALAFAQETSRYNLAPPKRV